MGILPLVVLVNAMPEDNMPFLAICLFVIQMHERHVENHNRNVSMFGVCQ